jgi:hypothetical protein
MADEKTQLSEGKLVYDLTNVEDKKLVVDLSKVEGKSVQIVVKLSADLPNIGEKIKQSIEKLSADLPNLGRSMQIFSLSMRSLYCEEKVSASVENGEEFISLREATRNDAVAYLKCVMPMNEICLLKLQEYFSYYECLNFDEWKESIPDILVEAAAAKEACQALVKVHDTFGVTLKERQDMAKELCAKFQNLQPQYDNEISALRERAGTNNAWAVALAFVPVVGHIACPLLIKSRDSDILHAVVKEGQQKIMFAASKTVSDVLMPALAKFINGLTIIAGFFNIVHDELRSFDDKMEDRKKAHYMMVKGKSSEIKAGCRAFHGVLPSVRTNFQAIPTEGTDVNYVDKWFSKQKEIINEKCKEMAKNFFIKALETAVDLAKSSSDETKKSSDDTKTKNSCDDTKKSSDEKQEE